MPLYCIYEQCARLGSLLFIIESITYKQKDTRAHSCVAKATNPGLLLVAIASSRQTSMPSTWTRSVYVITIKFSVYTYISWQMLMFTPIYKSKKARDNATGQNEKETMNRNGYIGKCSEWNERKAYYLFHPNAKCARRITHDTNKM